MHTVGQCGAVTANQIRPRPPIILHQILCHSALSFSSSSLADISVRSIYSNIEVTLGDVRQVPLASLENDVVLEIYDLSGCM